MFKKIVAFTVICTALLMMAVPTMAMLKVLEPALSEELKVIARNYLIETNKVKPEAITIEDGWVQEFWGEKVDVFMVEAIIDKGLATEKKVQVPVRVDQKVVLTDAEFAALQEQESAYDLSNPQIRIMTATDTESELANTKQTTNYILYYVIAVVLVVLSGVAVFKILRKA